MRINKWFWSIVLIITVLLTYSNFASAEEVYEFNYTGNVQTWIVPKTGLYQLEVWGAEGGTSGYGGKGGYAKGFIKLTKGERLYIYVGGQTGWNGGGSGPRPDLDSGGGATDIRKGGQSLNDRIIVAGGGGGWGGNSSRRGGNGGGLVGEDGLGTGSNRTLRQGGKGGTQTAGGAGGPGVTPGEAGSFGQGGSNTTPTSSSGAGGGGGGWYGGGAGGSDYPNYNDRDDGGGGGGSSYIGGVENGETQSGVNSGNGKARITFLGKLEKYEFNYTGGPQTWVVPKTGLYQLEVWGAQGGGTYGGKGGYSKGEKFLQAGETLYIYVGGRNGWNGGGSGHGRSMNSGGGATDIRYGGTSLNDRIIVAGGGGGQGGRDTHSNAYGGAGGGLTGGTGGKRYGNPGTGGTQTRGGTGGDNYGGDGTFGKGGSNTTGSNSGGGGGGGGWYGGGAGGSDYPSYNDIDDSGGGGGSGYIGGVQNGQTIAGVNSGDGKAVITLLTPFSVEWDEDNQFPSVVTVEDEFSQNIRFSNPEDGRDWNRDEVKLVIEWVRNGSVVHRQEITLPRDVAPGESVDQNFTIRVPDIPSGTYEVRYKLIDSQGTTADKMQVFENVEVSTGLNYTFDDQNKFPKEWLANEKRQVVIGFRNNENTSIQPNTHQIVIQWKQGNTIVHSQSLPITYTVGAGSLYRRTHDVTPPSASGTYTVIIYVKHNNGIESIERQIFEGINVHGTSGSWKISNVHEQVDGNLVTWTGRRFDPNRDVKVEILDDQVNVTVNYHVPMLFPVTRFLGGGDWEPMITVTSKQQVHKEKPAW